MTWLLVYWGSFVSSFVAFIAAHWPYLIAIAGLAYCFKRWVMTASGHVEE